MISRRMFGRRDQAPSSFAPTLGRLCTSAGVVGAVLVDSDGEAVDYAGRVDSFEIRVAAAEWRIILARLSRSRHDPWRARLRGSPDRVDSAVRIIASGFQAP